MPPPNNKSNSQKTQQQKQNKKGKTSAAIPEFKSTKNKHVHGNPSLGDFTFSIHKKKEVKKTGKFVPRSQRLAQMAAAKQN